MAQIRATISPAIYDTVVSLLSPLPNPDAAIAQFARLVDASNGELLPHFHNNQRLIHYVLLVFAHSQWLGETLIRNTDVLLSLGKVTALDRTISAETFAERLAKLRLGSAGHDCATVLARCKRREYIRILLRDVLGIATLAETTGEISALSDVLIAEAVREVDAQLHARYGTPRHVDKAGRDLPCRFSVLALGKLGGNELNYSSDIDLMFLYEGGLSNREYFIRLAQQTTELLSRHTGEGPVFRIDLRLRPQGSQEELAVALPHAVQYYRNVAQDWELQALIKARHSAGDVRLSREFMRSVEAQVYRPELNFAAIKTALSMREKIDQQRRSPRRVPWALRGIDIKREPGGIRDIEFLVQCLQRVYGGPEPWLRSSGTLFTLQKLHDKQHISGSDFDTLTGSYIFLRNLEHRLQLWQGQQTHRLLTSEAELVTLARGMTREGSAVPAPSAFLEQVRVRMRGVAEIYRRVIYLEQSREKSGMESLDRSSSTVGEHSGQQVMARLAVDAPALHAWLSTAQLSTAQLSREAHRNLERFLHAATTSSDGYPAILSNPDTLRRALPIFEHSHYATELLVRNPAEMLLLQDLAAGPDPPSGAETLPRTGSGAWLLGLPTDALARPGEELSSLRCGYRELTLLSSARDLLLPRSIWTSLRDNTAAADAAIRAAVQFAAAPSGFAVLALGRLGSCEFDILSDADLLFVYDDSTDRSQAVRAAERTMEALTAYTHDGTVFAVDTRLRPHGSEGELVLTPSQLGAYFANHAQPWERLTYLRLRSIAGDMQVADAAAQRVQVALRSPVSHPQHLRETLVDMRTRLENLDRSPNFKSGAGGTYDVDYVLAYLQLQNGLVQTATLRERIGQLRTRALLSNPDAETLQQSAAFLRALEHVVRLVTGRTGKWLPASDQAMRSVRELVAQSLPHAVHTRVEEELANVLLRTREIYGKLLASPAL